MTEATTPSVAPESTTSVAAPAVAPVPTPEVVQAPKAPVEVSKPAVTNVTYKDPASKQVGSMLKDAGIDPVKARDAITANGGTCTPEIYAALSAKHGEGMASLLSTQMTALHATGVEKANKADEAVYTQVQEAFAGTTEQGGKETWAELSGWAKDNIPNDQRKELNAIIQQGGMAAKLAVQELVNTFQKSGDFGQEMIGVEGDNIPSVPAGGDITSLEYSKELDVLLAKGHDYNTSKEVKTLQARRARSAQRNI